MKNKLQLKRFENKIGGYQRRLGARHSSDSNEPMSSSELKAGETTEPPSIKVGKNDDFAGCFLSFNSELQLQINSDTKTWTFRAGVAPRSPGNGIYKVHK